ncbi:hypothetical protein ACSFB8_07640 [Enterococcus faecalis]
MLSTKNFSNDLKEKLAIASAKAYVDYQSKLFLDDDKSHSAEEFTEMMVAAYYKSRQSLK